MNDLEGEHGIEQGIGKGQPGEDVVLGKLCLQPRLFELLPRQSDAGWGDIYAVHGKVLLGEGEHMSAAAASQIEDRLGAALVQQIGQVSSVFVGFCEDQSFAREQALPSPRCFLHIPFLFLHVVCFILRHFSSFLRT